MRKTGTGVFQGKARDMGRLSVMKSFNQAARRTSLHAESVLPAKNRGSSTGSSHGSEAETKREEIRAGRNMFKGETTPENGKAD